MLNLIDLTATDPVLYTNRLRAYFGKLPPMHLREQTIKSSVPQRLFLVDSRFSEKGRYESPPPLTPLTNFSPLTLVAKKRLYLLTKGKEPFLTLTHKSHISPPTYTHEHTLTPVEGNTTPKDNYITTIRSGHRVHWPKNCVKLYIYIYIYIYIKWTLVCFYGCYLFICRLSA